MNETSSKRKCNTCKVEQDFLQFVCKFRKKTNGFKNCHECRKGYRYYINKRKEDEFKKLSTYKEKKEKRKYYKQCVECLWLHPFDWLCPHDEKDRYIVYSERKRKALQKYEDFEAAEIYFFSDRDKNNKVRKNSSRIKYMKQLKQTPINAEKFIIKISL